VSYFAIRERSRGRIKVIPCATVEAAKAALIELMKETVDIEVGDTFRIS
jgi:hypothetical protein